MESRAAADPMIQKDGLARFAQMYLGDADPRSPLAAPLYADVSGLPPTLIQVGTAEVLLDDAVRIEARLRESGGSVVLEQYEDLIHVFQAFAPIVPESVEAIGKIGAFVKSHL
jgi:acetyl esterase/lipase